MSLKLLSRMFWMHLLLFYASSNLYAQERMVYGIVHAFDSIPLDGAEIYIKSTKQTVFTDSGGNFSAPCNAKDKLKIMARGFESKKIKIDSKIVQAHDI